MKVINYGGKGKEKREFNSTKTQKNKTTGEKCQKLGKIYYFILTVKEKEEITVC